MTTWYEKQSFSRLPLTASSALPALSLIGLDSLSLITATGADTTSYLQGQLTCDLVSLDKGASTLAAHCDAKGKVWSIIRLFHHGEGVAYVQPASVNEQQLTELKKYAVFSKITLETSNLILLGVAGEKADNAIQTLFKPDSNVVNTATGTAVKIEQNRWLLAVTEQEADDLLGKLKDATLSDSSLWALYDIKSALPALASETVSEFIPQALNLQALGDAISFKKGCYTGQETVARAKYRGINKRATYLLAGQTNETPNAGDTIERSVGENWRSGGTVISGYRFDDGEALILAVLPNNLDDDTEFRLAGDNSCRIRRITLPYALDNED
ncbi:tRNA-modifying protein YgfZ [Veronia nyctiphanis]|uniref:tRNA-modifying protein YgfZ n=1 Tax=Veronia nyctiphanis TaxID=1278244 RepID=A0A4Q0YP80_9GAMM|nr:tRNA-modifying protein YgfZ [Veronia nyctiphanis]RXJ72333.1 tRNA-modifying protein YgfZ [Veronia nyctiphanis]